VRGHLREGRAWVEGLLTRASGSATADGGTADGEALRARALFAGGSLALWQGDLDAAEIWLEQAAVLERAAGDRQMAARLALGEVDWATAYAAGGETSLEQAIAEALGEVG
jgi:hypothetical protein